MTALSPEEVSRLLEASSKGDEQALDRLMPAVYDELRRLAHHYMRQEGPGQTLQTTGLVNEAYIRLAGYKMGWQSRAHFFAIAAQAMRRILIERARKRQSAKGGGKALKVSLDGVATLSNQRAEEVMAIEEALGQLEALDPKKGRIVELRFYGGLNVEETAEVMGVSPATVKREWRAAKAWLFSALASRD